MAVQPVPLPPARWPDADTANSSLLFSPIRLGPIQAPQRTWVPAMVPWRATEGGFVTDANVQWYERFARGRPGVLVAEATGIRDVPSGPLLRIGHDRFVPGLASLVDAVRVASGGETRFLLQILDFVKFQDDHRISAYRAIHQIFPKFEICYYIPISDIYKKDGRRLVISSNTDWSTQVQKVMP